MAAEILGLRLLPRRHCEALQGRGNPVGFLLGTAPVGTPVFDIGKATGQ